MSAPGATDWRDPGRPRRVRLQKVAASPLGMVATQHFLATEAGVAMLEAGGNAIDAAVAAAFALGVCEPAASGLGGQTMLLVHAAEPRRTFALDGSSRAPHRVTPGLLSPKERVTGYRATTVPSTPAVLAYALTHHGTMELADVLAPAIRIAEEGHPITALQHALIRRDRKRLRSGPAAPLFLVGGRRTPPEGTPWRQPALARTLRRLAAHGVEDFYHGEIAHLIHEDMARNGGLLRDDDLAQVPWPIERRPVSCRHGNHRVLTFPPPGAGRTLVEMLNVLQNFEPHRRDLDTPRGVLLLCEVIRQANIDRADRAHDPEFYAQIQERRMCSREYAAELAKKIRRRIRARRRPPKVAPPPRSGGETTHLSVMDRTGNVVALTQSIERVFGAAVATPELGFLYNDYLSAFEHEDMRHPYHLRPNAVPWASVTPTIVFRGRRPWLALGSPGSERIASSVVQVLLRMESHHPFEAVAAPRFHCSIDGKVSLEAERMRDDIPEVLARHGYEVDVRDPFSFYLGCVQLVAREGKTFVGVADPRRDGAAAGPRP